MSDSSENLVRKVIDFDSADWLMDFEPPNPSLIVRGKTRIPMDPITLEPAEVSSDDDYWPTEVVGYHPEATTEVETPYEIQVPMRDLKFGIKGLRLIGATRSETLDRLGE